jgi:hypothetical protein
MSQQRSISRVVNVPPAAPGFVGPGHLAALVVSPENFEMNDPSFARTSRRHSSLGPLLHAEVWPPYAEADRIYSHCGHEEALQLALAGKYS